MTTKTPDEVKVLRHVIARIRARVRRLDQSANPPEAAERIEGGISALNDLVDELGEGLPEPPPPPPIQYRCYLIVTLAHNPQMPDVLPVVYCVQTASSENITVIVPEDLRGCRVWTMTAYVCTSLNDYQDASLKMDEFIKSPWCPSWIKDRIQIRAQTYEEHVTRYAEFCAIQNRSVDAAMHLFRPYYSFGGEVRAEDIFEYDQP